MRKNQQILFSLLLTLLLVGLAFWAGQGKQPPPPMTVVRLREAVASGTQLTDQQLELVSLPASEALTGHVQSLQQATGSWTTMPLAQGSLLLPEQLTAVAAGVIYDAPAPGRRLMSVELRPGDANGLFLAPGNRVDLHLVPKAVRPDLLTALIPDIRVVAVLDATGQPLKNLNGRPNSTALLCLDLDTQQASQLAEALSRSFIRVAVRNEAVS